MTGDSEHDLAEEVEDLKDENKALRERLEQHDEWLRRMMPGRRDILKMGGASALTALGIGAAAGPAAAADTSAGTVGEGTDVDIRLDQLRDPGGTVVADLDTGGDLAFQNGRGITGLSTLDTGEATIDGQISQYNWELVDTADLSGSPSSFSLNPGTYSGAEMLVDFLLRSTGSAADLAMRINGDGGSTGNYDYREVINGDTTGANEIVLLTCSSANAYAGGRLLIRDQDAQPAVAVSIGAHQGRTSDQAVSGHVSKSADVTAIDIFGDAFDSSGYASLYGRTVA